jgi:hypothetical protein
LARYVTGGSHAALRSPERIKRVNREHASCVALV